MHAVGPTYNASPEVLAFFRPLLAPAEILAAVPQSLPALSLKKKLTEGGGMFDQLDKGNASKFSALVDPLDEG